MNKITKYSDVPTDLITIGADPEVFAFSQNDRQYRSLIGKFPGSKSEPFKVNDDICIQVDNVLAEYNITPCSTRDEFVRKILLGLDVCRDRMKDFDLEPMLVASAVLPKEEIDNPWASQFGCEPDYNAYTKEMNFKPTLDEIVQSYGSEAYRGLRSAGGHVHLGFEENNEKYGLSFDPGDMVIAMDYFLGVWSVLYDNDSRRRSLYGSPGSFRIKPYGIEYRTLSNFWLSDPKLIENVFDLTKFAYQYVVKETMEVRERQQLRYMKLNMSTLTWASVAYTSGADKPSPKAIELKDPPPVSIWNNLARELIPDIIRETNVSSAISYLDSWRKLDGFPSL